MNHREPEQEEPIVLCGRKREQKVHSRKTFKGNVSLSAIQVYTYFDSRKLVADAILSDFLFLVT